MCMWLHVTSSTDQSKLYLHNAANQGTALEILLCRRKAEHCSIQSLCIGCIFYHSQQNSALNPDHETNMSKLKTSNGSKAGGALTFAWEKHDFIFHKLVQQQVMSMVRRVQWLHTWSVQTLWSCIARSKKGSTRNVWRVQSRYWKWQRSHWRRKTDVKERKLFSNMHKTATQAQLKVYKGITVPLTKIKWQWSRGNSYKQAFQKTSILGGQMIWGYQSSFFSSDLQPVMYPPKESLGWPSTGWGEYEGGKWLVEALKKKQILTML